MRTYAVLVGLKPRAVELDLERASSSASVAVAASSVGDARSATLE